jgi:hypothetical protein
MKRSERWWFTRPTFSKASGELPWNDSVTCCEEANLSCRGDSRSTSCCEPQGQIFPIPVVVLDVRHRVVAANASFLELLHTTRDEIAGAPAGYVLWPEEGGTELFHLVDEVLLSGLWFNNHLVGGVESRNIDCPLVIGGHRISTPEGVEPFVLLTVQPCPGESYM